MLDVKLCLGGGLMKSRFVVISSVGPARDLSKSVREQAFWDEHAAFIDRLVEAGIILLGGPLLDQSAQATGALLIVTAADEVEARDRLKDDPWFEKGILKLESISRWDVFIDQW